MDSSEASKPKKKRPSDEEQSEVLMLSQFSEQPRIAFGNVVVTNTKKRQLLIRNPKEYDQQVSLERVPTKKDFSVSATHFTVPAQQHEFLEITWAPQKTGNFREMLRFLVESDYDCVCRYHAIVFGSVVDPPKKVVKRRKPFIPTTQSKRPLTVIQTPSLTKLQKIYTQKRRSSNEAILQQKGSEHIETTTGDNTMNKHVTPTKEINNKNNADITSPDGLPSFVSVDTFFGDIENSKPEPVANNVSNNHNSLISTDVDIVATCKVTSATASTCDDDHNIHSAKNQWKASDTFQFSNIPETPSPRRTTFVVNERRKRTIGQSIKKSGAKIRDRYKTVRAHRRIKPLGNRNEFSTHPTCNPDATG